MRKIIVSEFVTLDGVMEDPGGAEGKSYGGWSLKFFSPEYAKFKAEELFSCDTLLLGRLTYKEFADAWPNRHDEFADRMNAIKKYVVTSNPEELTWENTEAITADIAEAVKRLKAEDGQDILVAGSSQLVDELLRHNLVDELRLMVHPIVIGEGKRLFKDGVPLSTYQLVDNQTFTTGTVVLTYKPTVKDIKE
jgi:dihydrofolate reductase